MQGDPASMQRAPRYADAPREVLAHLRERAALCIKAGVARERLLVDPGIGFGKRLTDNLALLHALPELRSLGLPILVGVSRKSFLAALGGPEQPAERVADTVAAVAAAALLGADVHRVHDVDAARAALRVADALAAAGGGAEA
jgi:dihydropteroate synthase